MAKQEKIDLEINAIETDTLIGFQLLCEKNGKNFRDQIINYMKKEVENAIFKGELTNSEIDGYTPLIEEY